MMKCPFPMTIDDLTGMMHERDAFCLTHAGELVTDPVHDEVCREAAEDYARSLVDRGYATVDDAETIRLTDFGEITWRNKLW